MVTSPSDDVLEIIEKVRTLIKGEKRLRCSTSDQFLLRFIKASEYDVHKSHLLIKDYFKAKRDNPEEFKFKIPSIYLSTISRIDLGYVVPKRDYKGRKIVVLRLGNIDPGRECWSTLMQSATLTLESLSLEPEIQDNGVNMVFDCTNFSLRMMKWATPHKLRDCIPMRFDVYHLVNTPLVFNVFFAALKPFMKDEFLKKLYWHKAPYETLHKHISPSLIPSELGGNLDIHELKDWYQIVLDKENAFNGSINH